MKKRLIALLLCLLFLSGCAHAIGPGSTGQPAESGVTATAPLNPAKPQEPTPTPKPATKEIIVHFINVGHGDCILIQAGTESMMIDTGAPKYAPEVIEYLGKCGVRQLDKVLITHPHIDHIGGLADIIEALPVKEVIMTAVTSEDPSYDAAILAISKHDLSVTRPQIGDRFQLADLFLTVLAPSRETNRHLNNTSVVTRLTYRGISLLLTGDASEVSEQEMIANEPVYTLQSTLLKLGHHGGASSSSQAFLDAVRPQYAVISCVKSENTQFPSPAVLNRLAAMGVHTVRTDQSGAIVVRSDGKTLQFK